MLACKDFKTQLALGDKLEHEAIKKVMETFSAEEEFHKINKRLNEANDSWASLLEINGLYRHVSNAADIEDLTAARRAGVMQECDDACSRSLGFYGLSSIADVSARMASNTPANITVYDAIMLSARFAASLNSARAKMAVYIWIGEIITSSSYDIQLSKQVCDDWRKFAT